MSMRLGICPKCGSHEIYHKTADNPYHILVIASFRSAPLEQFVCVKCGYLEQYVQQSKHGKLIKKSGLLFVINKSVKMMKTNFKFESF